MTKLPELKHSFSALIASPSISAIEAEQDQTNKGVLDLLSNWFSELGFHCQQQPVKDSRNKYNLLASLGSGKGGLLLAGHTDTVPFDEGRWHQDPFVLTEKDDRWYGLGTCDMKGFFALVLEAVKDMPLQQFKRPLYILASADEETTMSGAKTFAANAAIRPEYAIIGEPTSLRPVYMHKGHLAQGIRITGRSGHSSDPAKGLNAIDIMYQVIGQLLKLKQHLADNYRENAFSVPYPTMNFGHIHGGDAANRICGCCDLHMDIRPLPGIAIADLQLMTQQYLLPISEKYPGAISISTLYPGAEPFADTADSAWSQLVAKLAGNAPEVVNYATEAPYIRSIGCHTLVLGPGSIDQAHQPDEFIDLAQLKPTISLLKQLIYHACIE
ncbi:acetylornithine deacetylase [Shewanella yunxiaonensis]|uniref:Acetylornithine deacetylase n=1 Tax=Shewanella yunxiaonensis TaxID=2829809 RepID=A0ABX7YSP7_9GAMM|nr:MULTISPECIES: acetylornithine deacetylase [Shewanella]MDF0534996.1 acetylornithine deacetylase [Shewanella sp. A32]QUN05680.1 acetylornithine deacetylase [Shewanella yunxiaonensis]